ncbi:hypothetical protein N665_1745s0007 [Sinapis alba]|nr:hypothetical protein N665_1745s0007 [Sinapis alba]
MVMTANVFKLDSPESYRDKEMTTRSQVAVKRILPHRKSIKKRKKKASVKRHDSEADNDGGKKSKKKKKHKSGFGGDEIVNTETSNVNRSHDKALVNSDNNYGAKRDKRKCVCDDGNTTHKPKKKRSILAKIAIKHGVQLTALERMAEDFKKLTGGILLYRNKDYLVLYRGNKFLSREVAEALVEQEKFVRSLREGSSALIIPSTEFSYELISAGILGETRDVTGKLGNNLDGGHHAEKEKHEVEDLRHENLVRKLERKLVFSEKNLLKVERGLAKVEKCLQPAEQREDLESITDEEMFMFHKLGLNMKAFLRLGKRGVFDGTVENMHLHWIKGELVKIIMKAKNFVRYKQTEDPEVDEDNKSSSEDAKKNVIENLEAKGNDLKSPEIAKKSEKRKKKKQKGSKIDEVVTTPSRKSTKKVIFSIQVEVLPAEYQKKHGNEWRTFADTMGKHMNHVKDTWRSIQVTSKKKGLWTMEYKILFDLVNKYLRMKGFKEKNSKHGMLLDNILWMAISYQLRTRDHVVCYTKWYDQLEEILSHKRSDDEDLLKVKEEDELKEIADEYFGKESELGEGDKLLRDYLLKEMKKETRLGISEKEDEDFTNWYSQACRLCELVTFSDTKELYILEPSPTKVWNILRTYMDAAIEELGDVEMKKLFLLIKHAYLEKKGHNEGFKHEPGEHDFLTPFTLRPTSGTTIYPYFRNKIKTHRDLPVKVNPGVKTIRWEVSDSNPLIRGSEFDWQEGHSTFTTKEEAYDDLLEFLSTYSCVYENLLSVPVIKGVKYEKDKFFGADYTTNVEANGRGVQGVPSPFLRKNIKSTVWQKRYQAVVMHVPFKGADTKRILGKCEAVKTILQGVGVRAIVDERDNYAGVWKYADWEMKDVLLRIKIGPSELEKNQVRIVRRDTGVMMDVITVNLVTRVKDLHRERFFVAKKRLEESIRKVETWSEFKESMRQKKLFLAPWCEEGKVENIVLKKSCASLVSMCSVINQRVMSLSKIMDSVLLDGSKAEEKFDIEEVSKTPWIRGKFRDVVRNVHLDDEEHGKKKRSRRTCIDLQEQETVVFYSCEVELMVSTKAFETLKFKEMRGRFYIEDLSKMGFKLKGENVGISLK